MSLLRVTFHGHACFSLEDGKYHILIDPFINGNPQSDLKADHVSPTHILLTHGHGDHLGDAIAIAVRTKALIIAPNELAVYCQSKGAAVHNMHIGGAYSFDFGWVKLTPAWHGSAVIEDGSIIYTGNPCGFVVKMQGKYVYHAGDTGLFRDMELIGEMYNLSCALLPIGDNYVMGPADAVRAAAMLKADITVPMHYNTFPVIRQDPGQYVVKLKEIGLAGKALIPGECIEI